MILHNNHEAEIYVLASMLFDPDAIKTAAAILDPEDFYTPGHGEIYAALTDMYLSGRPADVVLLSAELTARGTLERIGGDGKLMELAGAFYTSANVKHHAVEVKRHSESRWIINGLTELLQRPNGVAAEDIAALAQAAHENKFTHNFVQKSFKRIDDYKAGLREKKARINTGFETLDALTGGLRIPSVAMIGAYPSVGKTAFAINIANYVLPSVPMVFFSLEMSCEMIYERLAASKIGINYGKFSKQNLNDWEYRQIETLTGNMKLFGFHVFDDAYYAEQQAQIIAEIKPRLVIVDYVQKVRTHRKTENRRTEIDYISGMYKQIAKQYDCVVLLLSQLTRPDKSVKVIKPTMAHLKESGALEQDGDVIGILHRPYVLQKDVKNGSENYSPPEAAYLLVDKNKFGNVGQIDFAFDGKHQRFFETKREPQGKKLEENPANSGARSRRAACGGNFEEGIMPLDCEEIPFV